MSGQKFSSQKAKTSIKSIRPDSPEGVLRMRIGDFRPNTLKKNAAYVNISTRYSEETATRIIAMADAAGITVASAQRQIVEKALAAGITV